MLKKSTYNSRGQVLLIVVVTMIVALTAGLTIASRTITNLRLTKQNEESQRAFQAASAGIDKLINAAAGVEESGTLEDAGFQTKVLEQSASDYLLNNGTIIDQDRGMDVWLSDYPNFGSLYTGNVTFRFGTSGQDCTATSGENVVPALEIVMLTGTVTNPSLSKYVFDPCSSRRTGGAGNNFSSGSVAPITIDGVNFDYSTNAISVTNGLIAKVLPLYNSAVIGIQWSGTPKSQGKLIESTGSSGETSRKVLYFESHPQIPTEVFPYVMVSQ